MRKRTKPADPQSVFCEVCLKRVPQSEAVMAEARDYVAYFCGLDCYDKWRRGHSPEPAPHEIRK